MKKCLSVFLSALILFACSAFPVNAEDKIYLKGDADGNGKITVEDARSVMRASIGLDPAPKPGTNEFKRMKCTFSLNNELTMEDARMVLRAAVGLGNYSALYTKAELTDLFNKLAQRVKSPGVTTSTKMTTLVRDVSSSDTSQYNFGEYDSLFKMMLEDDSLFSQAETVYPNASRNRMIYNGSYPLFGTDTVSQLTVDDITDITITRGQTVDILSSFPDRVNTVDITSLKAIKCKNTVKIHVAIRTEKYSDIVANGASYKGAAARLYGIDLTAQAADYSISQTETDGLFSFTINSKADDIIATGSADYYFTADTLMPIAAVYNINEKVDISIGFNISFNDEKGKTENIPINGKMNNNTTETAVYIFEKYFVNN